MLTLTLRLFVYFLLVSFLQKYSQALLISLLTVIEVCFVIEVITVFLSLEFYQFIFSSLDLNLVLGTIHRLQLIIQTVK